MEINKDNIKQVTEVVFGIIADQCKDAENNQIILQNDNGKDFVVRMISKAESQIGIDLSSDAISTLLSIDDYHTHDKDMRLYDDLTKIGLLKSCRLRNMASTMYVLTDIGKRFIDKYLDEYPDAKTKK